MTSCPRLGRLFGGCRFRPRYDTVSGGDPIIAMLSDSRGQLQAQPARQTYICDVCETCGDKRFRRRAPAASPADRKGQVPGKDQ